MKERLTGAAILVALIVLLVPELLRGPVRPVAHVAAAPAGEVPLRTVTIKVGDDPHAHDAATAPASGPQQPVPLPADTESSAPPSAAPATASTDLPVEAPTPKDAPPPKPEPPAPKPAPPAEHASPAPTAATTPAESAAGGAFMVQLGSFASHDNAERLAKQVKAQGFPVSVSRSGTGKHLYKVLVGPAHDRAAAVQLEAKLHAAGHTGAIVAR
ncbi:MAG: SPOR domain-containing protein [Proteobacteria bacterium]|nr:SPOR domain-containing protein [Pseudomonadota bacterium]